MGLDLTTAQAWAAILAAIGAGAVVRDLVAGFIKWLSGAAGRERGRNADLVAQRDDAYTRLRAAETERDDAYRARRLYAEHASALRGMLLERGVPPAELPPWPGT